MELKLDLIYSSRWSWSSQSTEATQWRELSLIAEWFGKQLGNGLDQTLTNSPDFLLGKLADLTKFLLSSISVDSLQWGAAPTEHSNFLVYNCFLMVILIKLLGSLRSLFKELEDRQEVHPNALRVYALSPPRSTPPKRTFLEEDFVTIIWFWYN